MSKRKYVSPELEKLSVVFIKDTLTPSSPGHGGDDFDFDSYFDYSPPPEDIYDGDF